MKRVLVTGGSGFVGRHALAPLAARGFEVHAVSRGAGGRGEGTWHQADLLEDGAARRVCERIRPTHLLHLAWYAEPGRYWTAHENLDWHVASARLIREFVAAGGTRMVTAGTCAEYDWAAPPPFDEGTTKVRPASLYAACKQALSTLQEAIARTAGTTQAWARCFYLYGPHEHRARLVPSVALALLRGEEAMCSTGEQRRDYLHVQDAAEALACLVDSGASGPFNVASGTAVRVRDVVEAVAASVGGGIVRFGARPAPTGEPAEIAGTISRLKGLGWAPTRTLARGIPETVQWWRSHMEVTR